MMDCGDSMHESDEVSGNIVDIGEEGSDKEGQVDTSAKKDAVAVEAEADFEVHNGIEFQLHEAAYSFYQEYAKSIGFTTSIKNSRRSKKSKEFIDAKFACSRYGVTPESDGGSSRRLSVKKTDCKASMHVKRRRGGRWYIHEFIKEHNHELFPALAYHFRIHRNVKLAEKSNMDILQAVSERTRKVYVQMSRQSGGFADVDYLRNELNYQFDKGRFLALDEGDGQVMLDYFMHIKKENPNFFYAIDLNENQCLRNLFWVDAKSRNGYYSFSDVVSFDTSYVKSNDKMPFAPSVGVNHHSQAMLLGCALIADESKATFVWLMKTWLRAMGGRAPKVIITDQDKALEATIKEVLPNARHCYSLWHVLERVPEMLAHVIKQHENFMAKFSKCIFKSFNDEQFDMRWWKMIGRFELQDNEWIHSLYEDRKKWVPTYMKDCFLAGISTNQRSESINSFFDKYIHKKLTMKELVRQYGTILHNRYEEEAIADFETWGKQPACRSRAPWEGQLSKLYTHTIFKKFQDEVVGAAGCHAEMVKEETTYRTYSVDDNAKGGEIFMVTWNEAKSEACCSCLLFEYKGILCRHVLYVLQIYSQLRHIPSRYILKRWTKGAKSSELTVEGRERIQPRVQLYNDLCKHAIELGEEGSFSEESYNIAFRTLVETLKICVNVNNRNAEESSTNALCIRDIEDESRGVLPTKISKRKSAPKKRKVQLEPEAESHEAHDSTQQDNLSPDGIALSGYYGAQQNVGLLQLNLMEPPHDGYYVNPQSMQGLGQLNSLAPNHDGFFAAQQNMHGLGHLDFRPPNFSYPLQDETSLRSNQLHGNPARHT